MISRIDKKLTGNDFDLKEYLSVEKQVDTLIEQATDSKNLCQMFLGWNPWY